jgi:hypothetical protein
MEKIKATFVKDGKNKGVEIKVSDLFISLLPTAFDAFGSFSFFTAALFFC